MEIQVTETAGQILDIVYGLSLLCSNDDPTYELIKENSSLYSVLDKNFDIDKFGLEIFFEKPINGESFFITQYSKKFFEYSNCESFIDYVTSLDYIVLLSTLLYFYTNKSKTIEEYDVICRNAQEFSSIVDLLEIEEKKKNQLFLLFMNPKDIMNKLYMSLKETQEILAKKYYKYNELQTFKMLLNTKIQNPLNFVVYIEQIPRLNVFLKDNTFNNIVLTISSVNTLTSSCFIKDEALYIYLGIHSHSIDISNEILNVDILSIFKALADSTRLEILNLLNNNCEMYAKEISESLGGIPHTKINYHMTLLCDSKIIASRCQGTKVFYSLNKDYVNLIAEYIKTMYGK